MDNILTDDDLEDIRQCILGQIRILVDSEIKQGVPEFVRNFNHERRIERYNDICIKLDKIKISRR